MNRLYLALAAIALYLLHQDFWFWREARPLVFGFLPVGLFYHVCYTLAISVLMWLLVKHAWPSQLEGGVGEWESGRVGEWESGRVGEWGSGGVGERESGGVEDGEKMISSPALPLSRSLTPPLSRSPALPLSRSPALPLPHSQTEEERHS